MLTLFGSKPSPYSRRLRLLMEACEYQFSIVDVYNDEDRAVLLKQNPTLKIPMLLDSDAVILDSRLIFQYLRAKYNDGAIIEALNLEQENLLTTVDAATDTFVNLFLLARSGIMPDDSALYFKLQNERLSAVFDFLEKQAEAKAFTKWNFLSMSLFSMLDWVSFRELYDLSPYKHLCAFHAQASKRQVSIDTNPR